MPREKRMRMVLGIGLLSVGCLFAVRGPLRQWVSSRATFANPAPLSDQVVAVIKDSPDPAGTIVAAWNTGKVVQREAAVDAIAHANILKGEIPDNLDEILIKGSLDADLNVREICLSMLQTHANPAYAALTLAQLKDCDPQVRLLGLGHLHYVEASVGIPAVMPVLDDSDPEVAATGLKLLEYWTGQEFGVKVVEVLPTEDPDAGTAAPPETGIAKLQAGVALAKHWWSLHQNEYPRQNLRLPSEALAGNRLIPAGSFALHDLTGQKINLSDYRGKVVVINFWTTWCTACVAEIPQLVQLENEHRNEVVVLGVSLDSLPDDDGDLAPTNSLQEIKEKVRRVVESRKINYPVLLDVHDEAGGQFNGGELPTTVVVDADGNIRRRFVGARKLATLNAMVDEAERPLTIVQKPAVALQ